MTYTIKFSDTSKASFTIDELKKDGPGSLDGSHTDLVLYGKGNSDYGEDLWNNLVHILENFSSAGPGPSNPIEGQLWYNKVDGVLSVYKEIKPSTSPKTYEWSKLVDVQSLSNPAIINGLLGGLTAALNDPSNTSKTALLAALGDSYVQKSGGTLTGPLNINPYTTDAANDPLQNNNLAVSVSYLQSYVTNKLANLDLSTLIGFDIPPFDSTLDAGYGGYYIKKVLDSSVVDNSVAGAQIVQSNIILPSYNPEIVNAKFAASREYVDAQILEFSKTFIKKIIWTDTLSISNSLIRGTLMAKLPTGFNYITNPTVTMSPSLTDAVLTVNTNDTKDSLIISFTGQTTATRILSKISIASSQITGIAGYIDSESLVYNLNTSSAALTTTSTTAIPTTTTTRANTTTTTTGAASLPSTTTTAIPTTSTTIAPITTTTTLDPAVNGYLFMSDVNGDYYISPDNLESPTKLNYTDALAYCANLPVSGNQSYKWEIGTFNLYYILYMYKDNLSSVCTFKDEYWASSEYATSMVNGSSALQSSSAMHWCRPFRKIPR